MLVEHKPVPFDGVVYILPHINGRPFDFAAEDHASYPLNYCGPGQGWLEKVVPDTIGDVPIPVACHGHDVDFELAPPTWDAFHASNSRFQRNIVAALLVMAPLDMDFDDKMRWAGRYHFAVDTGGVIPFWKIKKDQGYEIPFDINF